MLNWLRPLRRLRWQLALSYALITLIASYSLNIIQGISSAIMAQQLNHARLPEATLFTLQKLTPQLSTYFTPEPNLGELQHWLNIVGNSSENIRIFQHHPQSPNFDQLSEAYWQTRMLILDTNGRRLAYLPQESVPQMDVLGETAVILAALEQKTAVSDLTHVTETLNVLAATPIEAADGTLLGVLLVEIDPPTTNILTSISIRLRNALEEIPFVFLILLLIGAVFGIIATRSIIRRIDKLGDAAAKWSKGEFEAVVRDPSPDELGELAAKLNAMATQLQTLLQTRQQLAGLEERNRLARDLHDAVKQQLFAAGMQIGSTQLALSKQNIPLAQDHLVEAKTLVAQMRRELTGLIQELRPAALDDAGLAEALRTYVEDWSRQHEITADFAVQGERETPLLVEQTLFRIAQEALSNVARHSHATELTMLLAWEVNTLHLRITDNGDGFKETAVSPASIGLHSMEERLTALGGTLNIKTELKYGTTIEATLPLMISD